MRLIRLKVTNFRCFKDETSVDFDNITVLIGKNDSGSSGDTIRISTLAIGIGRGSRLSGIEILASGK